jgi:hypothetical protein
MLVTVALAIGWLTHAIGTSQETVIGAHQSRYGPAKTWKRYACVVAQLARKLILLRKVVCVGSVAELEELSGVKGITDLHRDKIDHITIPSKHGKGDLKRIEEVFDCWFESGR